jgi:hypothetical protein
MTGAGNIVIGIDPDVERIAWAAFEDGRYKAHGTIRRTRMERGSRVYHPPYFLDMPRFFERARKRRATVWVEDIFLGTAANGKPLVRAFKALAGVQQELVFIAWQQGLELAFVDNLAWHASQLGFTKGREALQQASHRRAQALAGISVPDPHEADAVCIAAHGGGLYLEATERAV